VALKVPAPTHAQNSKEKDLTISDAIVMPILTALLVCAPPVPAFPAVALPLLSPMGALAPSTAIAPPATAPVTTCVPALAPKPKDRMAPSLWAATAPMITPTALQTPALAMCVCLPALRLALLPTWTTASATTTQSACLAIATPLTALAPALAPSQKAPAPTPKAATALPVEIAYQATVLTVCVPILAQDPPHTLMAVTVAVTLIAPPDIAIPPISVPANAQ